MHVQQRDAQLHIILRPVCVSNNCDKCDDGIFRTKYLVTTLVDCISDLLSLARDRKVEWSLSGKKFVSNFTVMLYYDGAKPYSI